jgi:hypothetical protein
VELGGKRVGSIHQQTDVVLAAETFHFLRVHSSGDTDAVLALYLLPFSFGRVEVGLSGFIGNFHGGASFGGSS